MEEIRINELTTQARELGALAARNMATWVEMDEATARSILDNVDPEVMDGFRWPNLSGEMADDPTPDSLYDELGLTEDEREEIAERMLVDDICTAWEDAASTVFNMELQAIAHRTLADS